MDNLQIGQVITRKQHRDAVHMAIVPVVAGETLMPGQHIGVVDGKVYANAEHIGIVDPFLMDPVFENYNFWMFLYPGSITSLRHHWEHPAFGQEEEVSDPASKKWVEGFAVSLGLSYGALMEGADDYLTNGDFLRGGSNLEGRDVPDEFWEHYENISGKVVTSHKRGNFFSCSC